MSDAVIVAIITSSLTLLGVWMQNSKTVAIIETKLNALTKSVEKHNNFAEKIPVIEEQIKVANHRIDDLEKKF
jgi:peptidoglycan hydrolase CwlO-like protein